MPIMTTARWQKAQHGLPAKLDYRMRPRAERLTCA